MKRFGSMMLAIALGVGVTVTAVAAQERRLVAPVRGEATVELTPPDTKVVGNDVVTKIKVKNTSKGPIAGFKVDENWFKGSDALSGDSYRHPRPLQVDEVIEITLTVPRARVVGARNQYQFSHANGTIKPTSVKSLTVTAKPDTTKPTAKKG